MDGGTGPNQLEKTIRAVHDKKPVPEIDFTLHTMEDGTQVSTQERVCKGIHFDVSTLIRDSPSLLRGTSTSIQSANRRSVLLFSRPIQAKPSIP